LVAYHSRAQQWQPTREAGIAIGCPPVSSRQRSCVAPRRASQPVVLGVDCFAGPYNNRSLLLRAKTHEAQRERERERESSVALTHSARESSEFNEEGIVPLKRLFARYSSCSVGTLPSDAGIEPSRLLLFKTLESRLISPPIRRLLANEPRE